MKSLSPTLLSHVAQEVTTIATGWKVTRVTNLSFGWTDHDEDVTIDGVLYRTSLGLTPTTANSTDNFAVDTLDVTVFLDVTTEDEIVAGIWDNSIVTVFEYNWTTPPTALDTNVIILRHGHLGPIRRQNNQLTAEIRGLAQRLTTRIGRAYLPTCPWRHALWNGSTYVSSVECGVDLTIMNRIVNSGVTNVGTPNTLVFVDSTNLAGVGYYNEGLVTFTNGPNAGITREVRAFDSGTFTMHRPFPYAIAIGNAYSAVIGDNKTYETCRDVFTNLVNPVSGGFGGFPHLPGLSAVFANPTTGA